MVVSILCKTSLTGRKIYLLVEKRRMAMRWILILVLLSSIGCIGEEKPEISSGKKIVYDYTPEKMEKALESSQPTLLEFAADWCTYCWTMLPTMEELRKEYAGRVNFLTANFDEETELAEGYNIRGLPAFVFLNEEGEVEKTLMGYLSERAMRREIDALISGEK